MLLPREVFLLQFWELTVHSHFSVRMFGTFTRWKTVVFWYTYSPQTLISTLSPKPIYWAEYGNIPRFHKPLLVLFAPFNEVFIRNFRPCPREPLPRQWHRPRFACYVCLPGPVVLPHSKCTSSGYIIYRGSLLKIDFDAPSYWCVNWDSDVAFHTYADHKRDVLGLVHIDRKRML